MGLCSTVSNRLITCNLGGPAGKSFDAGLELFVLLPDFDGLIALARARTAQKRKAAFLCIIRFGRLDNLRVEHRHICSFVIKHNDSLINVDHVYLHTNAGILVDCQCIQLILRYRQILDRRRV